MSDTTELENQVGNAVDILLDLSRQLEELTREVERIRKKIDSIDRQIR